MTKRDIKILLAEDDVNLGFLLVDFLELQGFEVKLYKDGLAALKGFHQFNFDFCLLDIMMPKMNGYELAEAIRKTNSFMPIVFLTAKTDKYDKLKAFKVGVDDFITKPFDEDLLVCKILAIVNRSRMGKQFSEERIYHFGHFTFEAGKRLLSDAHENHRRLTVKESAVLEMLCTKPNEVVEREVILKNIWGENDYFTSRSLDVFITKLRKYLRSDTKIRIENIPNLGLCLQTA